MKSKRLIQTFIALTALVATHVFAFAPNVVVSNPELHSLVSGLMRGAGAPLLLLDQGCSEQETLGAFQKARLLTADIVIWSGPGCEASIARTLKELPALNNKLLTLSKYVPLLSLGVHDEPSASRLLNRDQEFFGDPKLAIMSVRMMTPRLVRLDPDNTELYLDNEIALIDRIKRLENEIHTVLPVNTNMPSNALVGVDRYFFHRFFVTKKAEPSEVNGYRKVATGAHADSVCNVSESRNRDLKPGPAFYFESMRRAAGSITRCAKKSRGTIKTTEHGEKHHLES